VRWKWYDEGDLVCQSQTNDEAEPLQSNQLAFNAWKANMQGMLMHAHTPQQHSGMLACS
jgi:hypothetical protein